MAVDKNRYMLIIAILNFVKRKTRYFFSLLDIRKFPIKKKIHFFINLGVGLFIAAICHSLQYTTWGESIINNALDTYIDSEAREAIEDPLCIDKGNLVFVEIDHDIYVKWGEPDITPRDKLAQIIRKCYDAGAKVILLDIIFEKEEQSPNNSGDRELKGVLEYIWEKEKQRRYNENSNIKKTFAGIVFCRRIGFKGDLKKSIFYDSFKNSKWKDHINIFYQAVSLFSSNANDNVIRYWNSYEKYVKKNEKDDLIWGAPLLAVMLYEDKASRLDSLRKKLLSNKHDNPYGEIDKFTFKNGNEYHLTFNTSHTYSQRIRFKIIPGKEIKENSRNIGVKQEGNTYLVSAKYNEDFDHIGDAFFRDKIVIIGNSSPDIGDIHRTPVGDMSGIYLLGNAVYTILNTRQVKHPNWLIGCLIELFIIVAAAYLFLYLLSFLVLFISVIFILVGLVELGYWYFLKTGFFLNSGLIFIGMVFHKITVDIEELFSKRLKNSAIKKLK